MGLTQAASHHSRGTPAIALRKWMWSVSVLVWLARQCILILHAWMQSSTYMQNHGVGEFWQEVRCTACLLSRVNTAYCFGCVLECINPHVIDLDQCVYTHMHWMAPLDWKAQQLPCESPGMKIVVGRNQRRLSCFTDC